MSGSELFGVIVGAVAIFGAGVSAGWWGAKVDDGPVIASLPPQMDQQCAILMGYHRSAVIAQGLR